MKSLLFWVVALAATGCESVAVIDEPPSSDGGTGPGVGSSSATGGDGGSAGNVPPATGSGGDGGGGGGGAGGAGGALSQECEALLDVSIVDVSLDAGADAVWSTGETATVLVTLLSENGNSFYPGISVTHAGAEATPEEQKNFFFALLPGEPNQIGVAFEGGEPGALTFEINLEHVNGSCPGTDVGTLTATID